MLLLNYGRTPDLLYIKGGAEMNIQEVFRLHISANKMKAYLELNDPLTEELDEFTFTAEQIVSFLKEKQITYGIQYGAIERFVNDFPHVSYPYLVAEGTEKEDGKPGDVKYFFDMTTEVDRSEGWDFRDVMRIPTVQQGEKLAEIIPPTPGIDGTNVYGKKVKARPGKPFLLRPGKNVTFKQEENSYYADVDGQVSIAGKALHVYDVYEVNESISLKVGNINFPGTVVIRGDVPTGFTIKADGDIKIFGLVEAATIIAAGSVTIREGIAGLKTGRIEAGENVHIGYVNQGIIDANNIYVERSIMHSECRAKNDIICKSGNIVGGVLSAGRKIEARNVGNRMSTKTILSLGLDKKLYEEQLILEEKRDQLLDNLKKLNMLYNRITQSGQQIDARTKTTLLRLTNSLEKVKADLAEVEDQLTSLNASLGEIEHTYLKVNGTLFPNVTVMFGKYQRTIEKEFEYVTVTTDKNEIIVNSF